jgi:hypothetical protein
MSEQDGASEGAYIKYIISQLRCPVCDRHYTTDDILLVEHRGELWCLAIACPECKTQGLVFAILKGKTPQRKAVTDLTAEELASFESRGPITIDDVLDFHDYLKDYRGDMAELLGNEP